MAQRTYKISLYAEAFELHRYISRYQTKMEQLGVLTEPQKTCLAELLVQLGVCLLLFVPPAPSE